MGAFCDKSMKTYQKLKLKTVFYKYNCINFYDLYASVCNTVIQVSLKINRYLIEIVIFDQNINKLAKLKKQLHLVLYRKYSSNLKFVMMAICVFFVTLFLPKQARFRFEYEKGKTWMQKDL